MTKPQTAALNRQANHRNASRPLRARACADGVGYACRTCDWETPSWRTLRALTLHSSSSRTVTLTRAPKLSSPYARLVTAQSHSPQGTTSTLFPAVGPLYVRRATSARATCCSPSPAGATSSSKYMSTNKAKNTNDANTHTKACTIRILCRDR